MKQYRWRPGVRTKVSAEDFGRFIETHDCRTPEQLVELAHGSPIEDAFLWNDVEAGHRYRLVQARHYLARLETITIETKTGKESWGPALVHVSVRDDDNTRRFYATQEELIINASYRESAVEEAMKLLKSIRDRFAMIRELAQVWTAIDAAGRGVHEKQRKAGRRKAGRARGRRIQVAVSA